jgi:hypothetical protein
MLPKSQIKNLPTPEVRRAQRKADDEFADQLVENYLKAFDELEEKHNGQTYEVEFDGKGTFTLAQLEAEGFFGEDGHELSWMTVAEMEVGQTLNFAGGAAPLGTIKRLS